jgi:hypothetical protein
MAPLARRLLSNRTASKRREDIMGKGERSSRKSSALLGKHPLLFGVSLWVAALGPFQQARAHTVMASPLPDAAPITVPAPAPPPSDPPPSTPAFQPTSRLPNHFSVDGQIFDANVYGLRRYLESIKSTDAPLYGQLSPDLERLEARSASARVILGVGSALRRSSWAWPPEKAARPLMSAIPTSR